MKNYFFALFCGLILCTSCVKKKMPRNKVDVIVHHHSQKFVVHLITLGSLPDAVGESSGLEMMQANSLWTHNDSRGTPDIFNVDSLGKFKRKITLRNEPNVDWEEITSDGKGSVFIGDFGNNECKRRECMIYKIPDPDKITSDSVDGKDIIFTYPDQTVFPPEDANLNFDVEAMVHSGNALYLFSKNRSIPYTGYSKLYKLPDQPGNYVAQLLDSVYTGAGEIKNFSITGAALNADHSLLVLISHERMWIFSHFKGDDFFGGDVKEVSFFGKGLSMEGVCFRSENEIYLTEERSGPNTGKLFCIDLSELLAL